MTTPPADARRLLITAGPTWEPIDAVRYLGNRSSGRMGVALAEAGAAAGYSTTLLLGPTGRTVANDSGVVVERFQTTAELEALLARRWPDHDVLIMAAAVADYRPVDADPAAKLRREPEGLTLHLAPTPDLLAGLREMTRPGQITIGYALEPARGLMAVAKRKLERKGLDAIVANPLETMDAATIDAVLLDRTGVVHRPENAAGGLEKTAFAAWLIDRIPHLRDLPPRPDHVPG